MLRLLWIALQASSAFAELTLTPQQLKTGIESKTISVILDVRTAQEFHRGHIEGATLAESLALFGGGGASPGAGGTSPKDFAGCEYCDIAVYCRSGKRARRAIQVLQNHGFAGNLFNGMGTAQWTSAGYDLVRTDSVDPGCFSDDEGGKQTPKCQPTSSAQQTSAPAVIAPPSSGSTVHLRRWIRVIVNASSLVLLFLFAQRVYKRSKHKKRITEVSNSAFRKCRR